jgi:hypothetical protein
VTPTRALAFVETAGAVVQAARTSLPSLAETVAGEPIRGSWWAHPRAREIYLAAQAVHDSPDVLVCKLADGKVTFVHRRLWPALVRLASRFRKAQLAKVREEHTPSGAHRTRRVPFPGWVTPEVAREARKLALAEAEALLSPLLAFTADRTKSRRAR